MSSKATENTPSLCLKHFPYPPPEGHKYDRGHTVVLGGDIQHTGAARLTARAALRIGSGLVTVACESRALPVYAASLMAVMTRVADTESEFQTLLDDKRKNAFVLGPGAG